MHALRQFQKLYTKNHGGALILATTVYIVTHTGMRHVWILCGTHTNSDSRVERLKCQEEGTPGYTFDHEIYIFMNDLAVLGRYRNTIALLRCRRQKKKWEQKRAFNSIRLHQSRLTEIRLSSHLLAAAVGPWDRMPEATFLPLPSSFVH